MGQNVNYKILAQNATNLAVKLGVDICGYRFTGSAEKNGESVNLSVYADMALDLSGFLHDMAGTFGLQLDIPAIFGIVVERLGVSYRSGALSFQCEFDGLLRECLFVYQAGAGDYLFAFRLSDFDLHDMPFVCEFVGGISLGIADVCVVFSTKPASYAGADVDAGLSLAGNICGVRFAHLLNPYVKNTVSVASPDTAKVFWATINKKISVVTLHRAGFSYAGGSLAFLFDMSLAVSPFTLSVLGAGLDVNLQKKSVNFLITGFGVAFESSVFTVSGAFNKTGEKYAGALTIGISTFRVTLAGTYERGHLLAYVILNANLGGPPAFFITGIAAAFGYNKNLMLPAINEVPKFPLVAAANGKPKMPLAELIAELDSGYIVNEDGQKFISAGIRFTTFNIAESFVLFNVCFGNKLTFSLLGVANISVPPLCDKNPIAFAQLALKAVVDPDDGLFSVEAQLTSESYVLDKKCKLTGGFAMFVWFGDNPHSGDFVITLGGYHPDYQKPAHYPDVPRLGMKWQISRSLSITGEVYFALTPSCLMAGARMAAVYQDGNLKAWFIAQADFLIQWKPFQYSAHVYISLGASYTVNLWFIHHTFTIELSADIHLWGPEFAGRARISWFIISFTIEFGDVKGKPPDPLTYDDFAKSFLPKESVSAKENNRDIGACWDGVNPADAADSGSTAVVPLTVSVKDGVIKESSGIKYVNADHLSFLVVSAIPVSDGSLVIRPMGSGDVPYESDIAIDSGFKNAVKKEYCQRVPTAMWGGEGELREAVSGYEVSTPKTVITAFPEHRFISLDELYELNTQRFKGFCFMSAAERKYRRAGSIKIFMNTADKVKEQRTAFLKSRGIDNPRDVTLAIYTADAEILFDEDILVWESKRQILN